MIEKSRKCKKFLYLLFVREYNKIFVAKVLTSLEQPFPQPVFCLLIPLGISGFDFIAPGLVNLVVAITGSKSSNTLLS